MRITSSCSSVSLAWPAAGLAIAAELAVSLARRDWPAETGQQSGRGKTFSASYASSGSDASNVNNPILDSRFSFVLCPYVTLRLPPLVF